MPPVRNVKYPSRRSCRLSQKRACNYQEDSVSDWVVHDLLVATNSTHTLPSSASHDRSPVPFSPSSSRSPSPVLSLVTKKSSSASRKRSPSHIPRPKNAFICYRSYYCAEYKAKHAQKVDHRVMSIDSAKKWKSMSAVEKQPFEEQARREKELHAIKYPDYRYRPSRLAGSPNSGSPKRSATGPRKASKGSNRIVIPIRVKTNTSPTLAPKHEPSMADVASDSDSEYEEEDKMEVESEDEPEEEKEEEKPIKVEEEEEFVPTADIPPLDICAPLLPAGKITSIPTLSGPIPPQMDACHFPSGLSYHEDFTGYISKIATLPISESDPYGDAAFSKTMPLVPISPEFDQMFRDFTLGSPSRSATPTLSPICSSVSCDSHAMLSMPLTPLLTDLPSFELQYPTTEYDPFNEEWMQYINFDNCS